MVHAAEPVRETVRDRGPQVDPPRLRQVEPGDDPQPVLADGSSQLGRQRHLDLAPGQHGPVRVGGDDGQHQVDRERAAVVRGRLHAGRDHDRPLFRVFAAERPPRQLDPQARPRQRLVQQGRQARRDVAGRVGQGGVNVAAPGADGHVRPVDDSNPNPVEAPVWNVPRRAVAQQVVGALLADDALERRAELVRVDEREAAGLFSEGAQAVLLAPHRPREPLAGKQEARLNGGPLARRIASRVDGV